MIIISARCIRLDVHEQMFDEGSSVKEFEWERKGEGKREHRRNHNLSLF